MSFVNEFTENLLATYSSGDHYSGLLEAKEIYTKLTGKLNEEDHEYEARMNLFNDWYLYNYKFDAEKTIVENYLLDYPIEMEMIKSLLNFRYSLFQYKNKNHKKEIILEDLLAQDKITLSKESNLLGLVENDIFIGRVVVYKDKGHALKGISTIPLQALPNLKKEIKRLNTFHYESFLLKLEELKIRSKHYAHLDASKIFVFS